MCWGRQALENVKCGAFGEDQNAFSVIPLFIRCGTKNISESELFNGHCELEGRAWSMS